MTNPISQVPSAQMPQIGEALVDPATGSPTSLFHQFLRGLWQRTGGAAGVDSAATDTIAQAAQVTATNASQTATSANATAIQAAAGVANAQDTANNASAAAASAINLASYVQSIALLKANNLGDLASPPAARVNLGVANYPAVFTFDTCPSGLRRGIPITQNMSVGTNFAGTRLYWGVAATADTVFSVSAYRGGAYLAIGTITFVNAGAGSVLSPQPAFQLFAGDALVVTLPGADPTLAQVGISIPLTLS